MANVDKQVNTYMDEETIKMLDDLCNAGERSRAQQIRYMIKREHERVIPAQNQKRVVMVGNNDMSIVDPEWAGQA